MASRKPSSRPVPTPAPKPDPVTEPTPADQESPIDASEPMHESSEPMHESSEPMHESSEPMHESGPPDDTDVAVAEETLGLRQPSPERQLLHQASVEPPPPVRVTKNRPSIGKSAGGSPGRTPHVGKVHRVVLPRRIQDAAATLRKRFGHVKVRTTTVQSAPTAPQLPPLVARFLARYPRPAATLVALGADTRRWMPLILFGGAPDDAEAVRASNAATDAILSLLAARGEQTLRAPREVWEKSIAEAEADFREAAFDLSTVAGIEAREIVTVLLGVAGIIAAAMALPAADCQVSLNAAEVEALAGVNGQDPGSDG